MGILIRQMSATDLEAVVCLEKQANPSPWSRSQLESELDNPVSNFDLLLVESEIAAYLCSWTIVDELQIQNVATAPGYRRRGYAEKLLRYVLERGQARGVCRVFLEVRSGNTAARTLYEKLGFKNSGVRRGYYADGEDAQLMEYLLSD